MKKAFKPKGKQKSGGSPAAEAKKGKKGKNPFQKAADAHKGKK